MSGSGARVLVVDDERAIQRALKATLEAAGYHVDVVGTCTDALSQVALKPPDLVLLDLLLPDGTGTRSHARSAPGRTSRSCWSRRSATSARR